MSYVVKHCVQDVLVLEKVIGALKAYSGTYNTYGSGFRERLNLWRFG